MDKLYTVKMRQRRILSHNKRTKYDCQIFYIYDCRKVTLVSAPPQPTLIVDSLSVAFIAISR